MVGEVQGCKLHCAAGFKCLRLSALLCFSDAVGKDQAEKVGAVQPGEEKLAWRPHSKLPASEGGLQGSWREIHCQEYGYKMCGCPSRGSVQGLK